MPDSKWENSNINTEPSQNLALDGIGPIESNWESTLCRELIGRVIALMYSILP